MGGGGALLFFISVLPVIPEMFPRESDGPKIMEREFTDEECGAVVIPCK